MNKKRLLLLADHLKTIDPRDYTITTFGKDALSHAARIPEFKKLGLRQVDRTNDNRQHGQKGDEPGGPITVYRGAQDVEAASVFFDISNVHAQYLFGGREMDPEGNPYKSPFGSKRDDGYSRDTETPAWTAARIMCFVRDPTADYIDRGKKAA